MKESRWKLYTAAAIVLLMIFLLSLPDPLFQNYYSPVLYDRNGRLLGAKASFDGQWRFPQGEGLNEKFVIALIEAEDNRFRYHPGIDPLAIARALVQNIQERRIVSGASTISMQTIRLARSSSRDTVPSRTVLEKIIEAFLALRLELRYSKEEILAMYAANAPFGANVVGIEAAAWRWFGRASFDLSWAEAATLAVLPNSPGLIHPGRNRDVLRQRRDALLSRLHLKGHIDEETYILSLQENVPGEPLPLPRLAPHLLESFVMEEGGLASFNSFHGSSLPVSFYSSIDRDIQERAAFILNNASMRFRDNDIMNGAVLILNTRTGEPLAYIGNTINTIAEDVDIVQAWRSSGSLLKPFLYAAMLDSGDILPGSLVSDIPTRVGSFAPENITRTYLGVVPSNEALIRSLNVPAARALREYGVDRFARLLRSLGLTTLFRSGHDYGLPLILGGAEVTLWEIAQLYAGLARAVEVTTNHTNYTNREPGEVTTNHTNYTNREPGAAMPISPGAAWLTLNALLNTVRPGDEAIWQDFAGARNIAWKTGTSFGFRDAWAIGVTPNWTVAVWIGNATGEGRAELRSAVTAAPVMFEIFSSLHAMDAQSRIGVRSWFLQPAAHLNSIEVCAASGFPLGIHCANSGYSFVPINAPIQRSCPYCQTVLLNSSLDRRITLDAGSSTEGVLANYFVLPPAEEWYYRRWNLDYRPLPPFENSTAAEDNVLALFNPEPGSQVFIPRELDGREGRIVFSAAHRNESEIIYWHLNDTYLGYTQNFHEMEARPPLGNHTLTLIDSRGNILTRNFTVLSRAD